MTTKRPALFFLLFLATFGIAQTPQRIVLDGAAILVDASEPSYVQYAAKDLGTYLSEISGQPSSAQLLAKDWEKG